MHDEQNSSSLLKNKTKCPTKLELLQYYDPSLGVAVTLIEGRPETLHPVLCTDNKIVVIDIIKIVTPYNVSFTVNYNRCFRLLDKILFSALCFY